MFILSGVRWDCKNKICVNFYSVMVGGCKNLSEQKIKEYVKKNTGDVEE